MQLTDIERYRPALKTMIDDQTNKLNRKTPGQNNAWRHLYYVFYTDRRQMALESVITYLSDLKFRKLNIEYMQQYAQAGSRPFFYHDVEVCYSNTEVINQLIYNETVEEVGLIAQSRETLGDYLTANGILKESWGSGKKKWYKERIAYCTLYKRYKTYIGVISKHCLNRKSKGACTNLVLLSNPFWETKYAKTTKWQRLKQEADS